LPYHAFARGQVVQLVAEVKNGFRFETEYPGPLVVVP
jgi:hypothetical protein